MSEEIQKKSATLEDIITAKLPSFSAVATKYLTPERLVKLALVSLSRLPDLRKVNPLEIVAELINCSRLGLEPNVEGGRWILPFKRRDKEGHERYEIVAITDYRGLIDVARRSGEVSAIHADMVRMGDLWEYWVDTSGPTLVHLRHAQAAQRGEAIGAYAIVKLRNGEVQAEFRTLEQINAAKKRSKGAESQFSPWQNDFEAMAKKTVIRRLYNLLPKTPEIQAAREVLAEEEERDRAESAIDVTPGSQAASTRTETIKSKLKAKVADANPPTPDDVPFEKEEQIEEEETDAA